MRSFLAVLAVTSLAAVGCAPREVDITRFSEYSRRTRDRFIWDLHDRRQWGEPEHKPICRDILRTQANYSLHNYTGFTSSAISLATEHEWRDLVPLIEKIYQKPRNRWIQESAFRALRHFAGKPIPEDFIKAARTLSWAGLTTRGSRLESIPTEEEIAAARQRFREEADKEMVLVFAITIAAKGRPKGGNDRGREEGIAILRSLDREKVLRRISSLREGRDPRERGYEQLKWIVEHLDQSRAKDAHK